MGESMSMKLGEGSTSMLIPEHMLDTDSGVEQRLFHYFYYESCSYLGE